MNYIKQSIYLLMLSCFLLNSSFASNQIKEPISYGIYNITDNQFLEQHHIDYSRSVASLTKLMTAYVFIKNMPIMCSAELNYEDKDIIKFTTSKLPQNEKITCLKLLNAMLISSDNMAAFALSRSIPLKTRTEFIFLMNKQAKEWGMKKTFFVDPAGLDPRNTSTVSDLSLLIKNTVNEPLINMITAKQSTLFIKENGTIMNLNNTNRLVRELAYKASISKTGFINESGYNLIYSPKMDCNGKELGIIILGSTSSIQRSNFAISKLKEYGCFQKT